MLACGFWQLRCFGSFYPYEKIAKACQRVVGVPKSAPARGGEVF